jgi:hypothetical protein
MFEILGEKCTKLVNDQGHINDLVFAMEWIRVREYKRVHGTAADMQAWDDECKKAWDTKTLVNLEPDAQTQKDLQPINDLMNASRTLYGWDQETCKMAWGQFAGFVLWAVKQGPAKIAAMAKVATPGNIGDVWMEDVAMKDPAYGSDWAKPGQAAPATNWTPWIVGALAVAGVGTGAVFYLKHRSATGKQNPTDFAPSKWTYKATAKGMSSKWRSYTQYFKSEGAAEDFLKEMVERHGAKSGELHDRRTNTLIAKV